MKIYGRAAVVLAPLALLTAPAAWWLRDGRLPLPPLLYFAGVGLAATFVLLRWAVGDLGASGRRGSRRAASRRELVRVKGLGLGPADDGFEASHADLAERIAVIKEAIAQEADLVFAYERDGKQLPRRAAPSYLHEYRSTRSGEVALCVNAYYYRRQTNVNFSVRRMSNLTIEPAEHRGT